MKGEISYSQERHYEGFTGRLTESLKIRQSQGNKVTVLEFLRCYLKQRGIFSLLQAQDLDRVLFFLLLLFFFFRVLFLKVRALEVRKNNERGLVNPILNKMKNSSFY